MKNQLKLSSIVALLIEIGAEVFLVRADVIDQQQPAIDISVGGLAIGGNSQQKLAQVVTCGFSGLLTEVRFPIACESVDSIVPVLPKVLCWLATLGWWAHYSLWWSKGLSSIQTPNTFDV
jgi:hypothetical protein